MRYPNGECSNKANDFRELVKCHTEKIKTFQKEYDETDGDINRCRYEFITDYNADTCNEWSQRLEQEINRELTISAGTNSLFDNRGSPYSVKKGTDIKLSILLQNAGGLGLYGGYYPIYKGRDNKLWEVGTK